VGTFSPAPAISVTAGNGSLTVNLTNTPDPWPYWYDILTIQTSDMMTPEQVAAAYTAEIRNVQLPFTVQAFNGLPHLVVVIAKRDGYIDTLTNVVMATPHP
jgi:hypothetical protein